MSPLNHVTARVNVEGFTRSNAPTTDDDGFQKENKRLLDVSVDGTVMVKAESVIADTGDIVVTGKSSVEGRITGFVKEAVSSEGTPVMEVEGTGRVYVAEGGKKIQIPDLDEDGSITINGNDVLAFESRIDYEIDTIGSLSGVAAGGLTNVYLTGPGQSAITTHGDPLVMAPPVFTDPDAPVAWSTNLSPSVEVAKTFEIGQTSGESRRMEFTGTDGNRFARSIRSPWCRLGSTEQ